MYLTDLIGTNPETPGPLAKLFTQLEEKFPNLKDQLQKTFKKSNDLFKYIKPEEGGESYKLSSLKDETAEILMQDLTEIISNIQLTLEEMGSLDELEASKTIIYFDGMFSDMLDVFTSNTPEDTSLMPGAYKQTKIGFGSQLQERLQKLANIK